MFPLDPIPVFLNSEKSRFTVEIMLFFAEDDTFQVLSAFSGLLEVNVYGVEVPGYDGRVGMASIVVDESYWNSQPHATKQLVPALQLGGEPRSITFDWDGLYKHVTTQMPSFQRPLFLRVGTQMEVTTTFKHRKGAAVQEGFDPSRCEDAIFFRDDRPYLRQHSAAPAAANRSSDVTISIQSDAPQPRGWIPLTPALYDDIVVGRVRL